MTPDSTDADALERLGAVIEWMLHVRPYGGSPERFAVAANRPALSGPKVRQMMKATYPHVNSLTLASLSAALDLRPSTLEHVWKGTTDEISDPMKDDIIEFLDNWGRGRETPHAHTNG